MSHSTHDHDPSSAPLSAEESHRLEELRQAIDGVDADLLDVLNRRAKLSLEVGRLKAGGGTAIVRPEREAILLDTLEQRNPGPLPGEHLRAIYREIISSSRALQRRLRVAYLGPEGTFSHMAAREFLGRSNDYIPLGSLPEVFDAVQKRHCDLGIAPIENSLNGTVGQSLDSFINHQVFVQAEWFSRIRLSLLSRETTLDAITTVYSHPQPLGQCATWLRTHLPHAAQISLASTAAAAQRVAGEPGSASIGDARVARRLGLHELAGTIEDMADNWTRFFLIGHSPTRDVRAADKSSIMFSLRDTPGSLSKVLDALAQAGVNMSKLESRPMRGERWKYVFFADLDCDITDPAHAPALEEAAHHCLSARVLGAYPTGQHIQAIS